MQPKVDKASPIFVIKIVKIGIVLKISESVFIILS